MVINGYQKLLIVIIKLPVVINGLIVIICYQWLAISNLIVVINDYQWLLVTNKILMFMLSTVIIGYQ